MKYLVPSPFITEANKSQSGEGFVQDTRGSSPRTLLTTAMLPSLDHTFRPQTEEFMTSFEYHIEIFHTAILDPWRPTTVWLGDAFKRAGDLAALRASTDSPVSKL